MNKKNLKIWRPWPIIREVETAREKHEKKREKKKKEKNVTFTLHNSPKTWLINLNLFFKL